jgi:dipeptidyl aminopeptidase/acylaminoacyl peptidase
VIYPVELSADRRAAFFFRSDETLPIALERLPLDGGSAEQLLRIDSIRETDAIRAQRWRLSLGDREIPVYAYAPPGPAPERGWPCVIWLHGSSSGFSPRWHPYAQYFAHAGFYFVALNFSGSPGLPWLNLDPHALDRLQLEEARRVREAVGEHHKIGEIDSQRVFLVGVSLGTRILQDALRQSPTDYAGAIEYSPLPHVAWEKPFGGLPPLLEFLSDNDPGLDVAARLDQIERQRQLGSLIDVVRFRDEGHDLRALSAVAEQLEESVRFLRRIASSPRGTPDE